MTTPALSLSHYSDEPEITPRPVEQGPRISTHEKPRGLWVSVDGPDDWPTWCRTEMPEWIHGKTRHVVVLDPAAHILRMSTYDDLTQFTDKYGRDSPYGLDTFAGMRYDRINWTAVATEYQGIIITPYVWAARMDLFWYYGWDCASGCIWDPDAIASITPTTREDTNTW